MNIRDAVNATTMSIFDTATLDIIYQPINPAGFVAPCFAIKIINKSKDAITISYDGVTDHDFIPNGEIAQYTFQNNASPASWKKQLAKGTIVYLKGPGVSIGLVYLISGY